MMNSPWLSTRVPWLPVAPQGVRPAELLAGATDVLRVLRHQRCGVAPGAHGQHHPAQDERLDNIIQGGAS